MNETISINHSRPLAVIIGAGQNGRGFIARLLNDTNYILKFIDIDNTLIHKLNTYKAYNVHFFDKEISPVSIENVSACHLDSEEAIDSLSQSSIIFTSIGENNLPSLVDTFTKAVEKRLSNQNHQALKIITCENGESSEEILRQSLTNASLPVNKFKISESIILCSTVSINDTPLDIVSEHAHYLPYNEASNIGELNIPGFVATKNFRNFLKQKLYTYNTISACIAYLGAIKQYEIYSEAANDKEIQNILKRIIPSLNEAISSILNVDLKAQKEFSNNALKKFMDKNIVDNIAKNARDVTRKLGPNDRLVQPALMVREIGEEPKELSLVMAAALHYDDPQDKQFRKNVIKYGPIKSFSKISGLPESHQLVHLVSKYYHKLFDFKQNHLLDEI